MDWWDAISRFLQGGTAAAGTGMGIYGNIQGAKRQQAAYDFARQQALDYQNDARNWMAATGAWRNQMMGGLGDLMGQAMQAMNAPINIPDTYAPMTDAAAKAMRRGITAQAALRTGGNEGGYIDNAVGEGLANTETNRYTAAKQLDAQLAGVMNQNRMAAWPAILSAFVGAMNSGMPSAPLRPVSVGIPPVGSTGDVSAFGNFLQNDAANRAKAQQTAQTSDWQNTLRGWYNKLFSPGQVDTSNFMPDYPTGYGGWT